jgi:DUF971 family protein
MPSAPGKGPPVWPTEVRLRKDKAALCITFDNGEAFEFPAEFLGVNPESETRKIGDSSP